MPIAFDEPRLPASLDRRFPGEFTEERPSALTLAGSLMTYRSDENRGAHFERGHGENPLCPQQRATGPGGEPGRSLRTYPNLSKSHAENYLSQVQQAVIRKQILKISYLDRKQAFSTREIEPIGLSFYSNQWHTVAWCWKRRAYRDFIVSSIQELCPTFLPFRKQDHLSMDEYIATLIQNMQNH
ncbi:MAG: WYL domain-containing protein [Bacteroidales bacterium]